MDVDDRSPFLTCESGALEWSVLARLVFGLEAGRIFPGCSGELKKLRKLFLGVEMLEDFGNEKRLWAAAW